MIVIGKKLVLVGSGFGLRADGTEYYEQRLRGVRSSVQGQYYNYLQGNYQGGGNKGGEALVDERGITAELVTRTPVNTFVPPITQMRQVANNVQKDLLEPPYPIAFEGLSDEIIRTIKTAIDSNEAPEGISLTGAAEQLYKLLLRGVSYRIVSQPVLHLTQTLPLNVGNLELTYSNVNNIVTTDQVADTVALPTIFAFTLPASGVSEYTGYTYGWKKQYPEVLWTGDSRYQVNYTFEFGLWSDDLETFAV